MRIFGYDINLNVNKPKDTKTNKSGAVDIPPTSARKSRPSIDNTFESIREGVTFINPGFIVEIIPVIRKLSWINPDLGLALNDLVRLTNTGHRIKFDQNIPEPERDKMRRHLYQVRKTWGDGIHGINGLINKQIAQIWVSGALSVEWVVNTKKTSIANTVLVNPETIHFSWNKTQFRFIPYQKQTPRNGQLFGEKMVKLNTFTYKYFSVNGDTELPYGIPPFLTALNGIDIQKNMDKNIDFIIEQLGLIGFFETLIEKPNQTDGETLPQYNARLTKYLDETKVSVKNGLKDGTVIGFKDDHEFNFHSPTKNLTGAVDLYVQNEIKVAKGLKVSPEFLGIPTNGSESAMGIIFTKMLSQLVNVQELIKTNLEFGYMLELTLAGFKNVTLEVEFKPSTITDELKYQQAQEYKIRNVDNKYQMGVIGQQQKAEELGYDKPDQKEPRAPIDNSGKADSDKEKDKSTSERKTADKKKTVAKRKDTNTKPS